MPEFHNSHTAVQYMSLAQAFDYLNASLFGSTLPTVLITFQRHANSKGYYSPGMFEARASVPGAPSVDPLVRSDEIALNPDTFKGRSDEEIFSTFAHEMVHLWECTGGRIPKSGYHTLAWADKMESIGLMPSDTGMPGGKRTGPRVTHYIIPGGLFAQAYAEIARRGVRIAWESAPKTASATKKAKSKTKFTCAMCGLNAWAKPDATLACSKCDLPMLSCDDTGEGGDED